MPQKTHFEQNIHS